MVSFNSITWNIRKGVYIEGQQTIPIQRLNKKFNSDLKKFAEAELETVLTNKQFASLYLHAWREGHTNGLMGVWIYFLGVIGTVKSFKSITGGSHMDRIADGILKLQQRMEKLEQELLKNSVGNTTTFDDGVIYGKMKQKLDEHTFLKSVMNDFQGLAEQEHEKMAAQPARSAGMGASSQPPSRAGRKRTTYQRVSPYWQQLEERRKQREEEEKKRKEDRLQKQLNKLHGQGQPAPDQNQQH